MAKKVVNHISETGEVTGEKVAQVGEIKATANQEIADSLKKSTESKELSLQDLQNKILSKPNMTDHHKQWLQKKTDELISMTDKAGLEQLDKNINFTDKWGLIINTPQWPLKFSPKQASFDDVKHIEGIKEWENIWTKNQKTNQEWLWVTFEASKKMIIAGKRICSVDQYRAAINMLPGNLFDNRYNWLPKVKDFFGLLWADQYDLTDERKFRVFWLSSRRENRKDRTNDFNDFNTCDDIGQLSREDGTNAHGVWFLED